MRNAWWATVLAGILITGAAHGASVTRTVAFDYDPASGLLTKEIVEPDNPNLCVVTSYVYDAYGNKTSATTRNCNGSAGSSPGLNSEAVAPTGDALFAARSSGQSFDARGRFPVTASNALGQSETRSTDPVWGAPLSLVGPNGLATTWQYDSFGRKIRETRADGTQTQWSYLYCTGVNGGTTACPTVGGIAGKIVVQTTPLAADGVTANGPWSRTYYDALGREIRSETLGFDGVTVIAKDTHYDSLGRTLRTGRPYYSGQAPQWFNYTYDVIDRVITETHPDGTQTGIAYNGLSTTTTNALNQAQTKTKNSQGQLISVRDAANNVLSYAYDPYGNLARTADPAGNAIVLTYDGRGRKIRMDDPDMGSWTYAYNALGELLRQTDAKGQVTTMTYDLLGRMTRRAEADLVSNWYYDAMKGGGACAKGIGKLCQAEADNGYARSQSYDSLGRPAATTTTIDTAYTSSVGYDAQGRVATQTYPTGLAVKYVYTPLGYLKEVRNNQTDALYWRADTMDAEGHLLQQTQGNGVVTQQTWQASTGRLTRILAGPGNLVQDLAYQYDVLGNVSSRQDNSQSLNETFLYDNLNRLVSSTVNSGAAGIVAKTYSYDSLGNITGRSDLGTYTYPVGGVRPHAVTEIALAGGGKRQYSYDANGNLTSEVQRDAAGAIVASKGRTEVYTSFNMPQALGAPGISLAFAYSPEHQRIRQIAPSATTIYLHPDNEGGLLYEKDTKPNGTVEHKHFISAGKEVIALVKQTGSVLGANTSVRYFHRDALGSTSTVTDEAGAVVERLAYEPFGKRRFAGGGDDPNNTITPVTTDRGFTNHEHLDELGLIHMNGRIYDPVIGRFMSPDPYVQSKVNLQAYGRYTYLANNPFSGTDPSGYKIKWGKILRTIVAIVAAIYVPELATQLMTNAAVTAGTSTALVNVASTSTALWVPGTAVTTTSLTVAGSAVAGAAGGFAASMVSSGGDLEAGLKGAATGALFGAAGTVGGAEGAESVERLAAHAGAGCASGVMNGNGCAKGAASSVVGKFVTNQGNQAGLTSDAAKFVVATVAGGTAAAVGGGKFTNGAETAAFGYLFNHCSRGGCTTKLEQALYDWWPGYKAGTLLYNQTMGDGSWTGWEVLDAASVGAGVVGRGLQALQGLRAVDVGIEFGANANQVSHAFRHIDAVGLSRDAVTTAIRADMPALQVGQGVTRTVTVNGVDLTYRAHRVNETLVNVGRITPPRP